MTPQAALQEHGTAQGPGGHLEIGHEVRQVGGLHRCRIRAPQRERALQYVQRWTAIRADRCSRIVLNALQLQRSLHLGASVPVPLDMTQQRAVQSKGVLRRQQLSQLSPGLHDAMVSLRHSHVTRGDVVAIALSI